MPAFRHTIVFDDSLNMLWKGYPHRADVDYAFNRSVKGSAEGCAFAMRVGLRAGGSLRLHTDLAYRSDLSSLSVQFWVRGASSQFDGKRCAAPSPRRSVGGSGEARFISLAIDSGRALGRWRLMSDR